MTSVTYYGHETRIYLHYTDINTGRTLVAQPGQTYNVAPAGGNLLSAGTVMPMDGRFAQGTDKVEKNEESKPKKAQVTGEDTMPSAIKE